MSLKLDFHIFELDLELEMVEYSLEGCKKVFGGSKVGFD